jgi:predicted O-methyltransferase YrrM
MSEQKLWADVDAYLTDVFVDEPAYITAARNAAREAKLPDIAVSPTQGRFLAMLVTIAGAKRILEIGTLGGYSTLWLAHALPADGTVITFDHNPVCAGVARANFAHAGFADRIELHYGDAIDSFKALVGKKPQPFDLIFIDANKPDYSEYLKWSLRLSRSGTIIVADNIVRGGEIINLESKDPAVAALRRFNEEVAANKKLETTALQLTGSKGLDGFAIIRVK